MHRVTVKSGKYVVEHEGDDKTITQLGVFNTSTEANEFLKGLSAKPAEVETQEDEDEEQAE